VISIRQLTKGYDRIAALDGFSLEVQAGELFGLVGPNSAGKTTLIRILATLSRPDSGGAIVAGHDIIREPYLVRAATGYMPDVPGVYQDLTVEEFLAFFSEAFRLHGTKKRAAINRALSWSVWKTAATPTLNSSPWDGSSDWFWLALSCTNPSSFSSTNRPPASTRWPAFIYASSCDPSTSRASPYSCRRIFSVTLKTSAPASPSLPRTEMRLVPKARACSLWAQPPTRMS